MVKNRLRLNPAKNELIWLGSLYHLQHAQITKEPLLISGTSILPSKQVRNLEVILECDLSVTAHVNKLLSTCFYHIRHLCLVRRLLGEDAAHALVRALIHSHLDYCNGVLASLTMEKFGRMQSVLKAAAHLIFKFPGLTSISELIRSRLHWLNYPYYYYSGIHVDCSEIVNRHFINDFINESNCHCFWLPRHVQPLANHFMPPVLQSKFPFLNR